ncbi:hypothetical protein SO802_015884 [Lithocarpus litseifolius]|uniref:Uncharacterized protein n=1 Tax=Lithocarpus litseifolius TaxID=425828 RepID=A0AAW2CUY3_9ROSI
MWIVQKKKLEHEFKKISKLVSNDTEITSYVEKKRIKKLKGVKAKEFMLWPPVSEITVLMIHQLGRLTSRVLLESQSISLLRPLLLAILEAQVGKHVSFNLYRRLEGPETHAAIDGTCQKLYGHL